MEGRLRAAPDGQDPRERRDRRDRRDPRICQFWSVLGDFYNSKSLGPRSRAMFFFELFRTASCETCGFETIFSYEALGSPGEAWDASGLPKQGSGAALGGF